MTQHVNLSIEGSTNTIKTNKIKTHWEKINNIHKCINIKNILTTK